MTPSEIEEASRRMLNAVGSSFWYSSEILSNYLYMSALEMAEETFCIQNRYSTPSIANQQEYEVPNKMLAVKRITYDSEKLKPISLQQLDSIDLNTNTTVVGIPQYYYHYDDAFGLYPAPQEADKTILVHSYDQPSVPTDISTLEIPSRFHGYLVIGTAFYMSLKELGHPHVQRFEWMWNHAGNPNNAIMKAKRSVRMMNKDNFNVVLKEEDQPSTNLGMI